MSDFHAFQKGGDTFLFFARSARLYQLSEAAAGMLAELSDRGSGRDLCYPGQGFPLQNPPPTPALYSELRDLLQKELSIPLPASSGLRPTTPAGPSRSISRRAATCPAATAGTVAEASGMRHC